MWRRERLGPVLSRSPEPFAPCHSEGKKRPKNLAQGKLREGSAKDEGEGFFVTNSILEIMPLPWLDGKPIGTGRPGQLTRKLMAGYRELVNKALGEISPI